MRGFAGVAQSVEQLIRNEKVGGSIPLSGTKVSDKKANCISVGFFLVAKQDPKKAESRHDLLTSKSLRILSEQRESASHRSRVLHKLPRVVCNQRRSTLKAACLDQNFQLRAWQNDSLALVLGDRR